MLESPILRRRLLLVVEEGGERLRSVIGVSWGGGEGDEVQNWGVGRSRREREERTERPSVSPSG